MLTTGSPKLPLHNCALPGKGKKPASSKRKMIQATCDRINKLFTIEQFSNGCKSKMIFHSGLSNRKDNPIAYNDALKKGNSNLKYTRYLINGKEGNKTKTELRLCHPRFILSRRTGAYFLRQPVHLPCFLAAAANDGWHQYLRG